MRILLTALILFSLFSCQEKEVAEIATEEKSLIASEQKQKQEEQPIEVENRIVFRDAQGNLLSESEKDSIVENTSQLQALRRFDNESNNTEYILFENYAVSFALYFLCIPCPLRYDIVLFFIF